MAAVKLTKSELEKIEKLQSSLEEASQKFSEAVDEYNDKVAKLNTSVSEAFEAYKRAAGKVHNFAEKVSDRLSNAIDDRTEEWQDSDDGISSIEFRDEWKEFHESAKEYLEPEFEVPEELETPDLLDQNLSLYDLPQDAND